MGVNIITASRRLKNVPITLVAINSNVIFTRVRVDEHQSDCLAKCHITGQSSVPVIKVPEDTTAVLTRTLLNTLER
jgi:hypothetical protein